jgi:hypothetical protein
MQNYFFKKKFLFFCILICFFSFCNTETYIPKGVPLNAKFDRKRNVYTLRENDSEKVWYDSGKIYSDCKIGTSGKYEGVCNFYSEKNQILISTGSYKNGLRDGLWYWYFPNSKVYFKQEFDHTKRRMDFFVETDKMGTEHGSYERFYDNGQLEETGTYDTGYKTGTWKKFYRSGKLEYQGEYKLKQGKSIKTKNWLYYFPNEKLEAKETYTDLGELISRITYRIDGSENCKITKSEVNCIK